MSSHSQVMSRLWGALEHAGLSAQVTVDPGTAGVASPMRLAIEWAGFTVTAPWGPCYAKVLHDDMRELIDVQHVAQATRQAAACQVTPDVRLVDVAAGVLLLDALPATEWRGARLDELMQPERLRAVWALKKRLQAGASPGFSRSPLRDIQRVLALCARDGVALPADHAWIGTCIDLAWTAVQSHPAAAVPLHGDGVASNVMIGPGGALQLIDFDYGGEFDPWYDVAVSLNELYAFEPQWRDGIRAWAGECQDRDYARCRLYALIDDWYWTLWGLWVGATSSRPLEFSKVGQWTLLRCRQSLCDPRFESWLRQVEEARA
ncbi:phosphotransferase [Pseudomonas sp. SDO528_S397]